MIDSVSKDTACAVQELDVLSLKQSDGAAWNLRKQASPPTIEQIASEAALDTQLFWRGDFRI
jgi:hypothetical protein